VFDPGQSAPWWAVPWPNDATWGRRLRGLFPHPVARRFEPLATTHGPSPSGCAYFAFDGDPGDMSAEIVDLDDGRRLPAEIHLFPDAGRWHPANLVAVAPVPGFVMREGVAHAVLLRTSHAAAHPAMAALLAGEGAEPFRSAYRPLTAAALDLTDVTSATVFTPADVLEPARRLTAAALTHATELRIVEGPRTRWGPGTAMYEGRWLAPQFRTGSGRRILRHGAPTPEATGWEPVPFGLVLPSGDPPQQGWPLVLSIHGGGCRYLDRLPEICGSGAPRGLAVAAQTLPYNPGRVRGGRTFGDIAYFNVANPAASLGLFLQAVAEQMLFLRLLLSQGWPLDPERLYVIGHSNGGTTAGVLLAVEPLLKGGVVAGFGGHIGTYIAESDVIGEVMDRTWPALTLRPLSAEPRSRFHPLVNLAHTAWGPWDTVNMAPRWILRPDAAVGAKHVYLAQGMHDEYASVRNSTAVITAAGLDVAGPPAPTSEADWAHDVLRLRDSRRVGLPVCDNLTSRDGTLRTGVAVETVSLASGHEVCFEDRGVLDQWVSAVASHAAGRGFVVGAR